MRTLALAILWICTASDVYGQASAPPSTFEVASVKPSPPDATGMFTTYLPDGGVRFTGISLKNLISSAYGVRPFQVSGGPKWIDTERFDIAARPFTSEAATPADPAKLREQRMKTGERLRDLLAQRFQLTLHRETREEPVYSLVVAKGGPKIQESTDSENMIRRMGRGELKGQGVALLMLVINLSSELGRRVIDKTGLAGKYSFDLKWTPGQPTTSPDASDPGGASIFTALQEQLGLRLEAGKGPVEILVIDGAQKPSAN